MTVSSVAIQNIILAELSECFLISSHSYVMYEVIIL